MGNSFYCVSAKTSFENLIDDIFLSFPLRNTPLNDILLIIDKNIAEAGNLKQMKDTSFQKIYNTYGVDHNNPEVFHVFWGNVKKYMNKNKSLCLYFTLCLLSKYDVNQDSVEKLHDLFFKFLGSKNKPLYIQANILHDIICKYFCVISYLAIEPFKIYSVDPIEFTNFFKNAWHPDKIHNYVWKFYFKDIKSNNFQIDLHKFLSKNLRSLSDDVEFRRSLTNYTVNYHDNNKIV